MNKLGCFFVILVFMTLVSGISKAGQTIDLSGNINQDIAGNGNPNSGQGPFNSDLNDNTLNITGCTLSASVYISGAWSSVGNTIFSNNVLNINAPITPAPDESSYTF
ncbi:MAG: hypothetical protein LBD98_01665 [Endomicrobium sp.]|jgi:hypothetical protein|nr:hypothetical protein [Endomicrobium sp.]